MPAPNHSTTSNPPVTTSDIKRVLVDNPRLVEYRDDLVARLPGSRYLKIKPVSHAPEIFQPLTDSCAVPRSGRLGTMFYVFITHHDVMGFADTIAHEFGHVSQDLKSPRVNKSSSPFAELDADVRAAKYGFNNVKLLNLQAKKTTTLLRSKEPGAWLIQFHLYGDAAIKNKVLATQATAQNPLFNLYMDSEWFDYPNDIIWPTEDLVKARKDWDDWVALHPDA